MRNHRAGTGRIHSPPVHPATWIGVLLLAAASATPAVRAAEFSTAELEFFETRVRPLLVERCHDCHGAEEPEAGLRLISRELVLQGGDSGPAIVPGKPADSELIRAIHYDPDGYQMPPDGKLPADEIAVLTRWVEMGAPWPDEEAASAVVGDEFDLEKRAQRWSFQPLSRPAPPDLPNDSAAWCRNPVDQFILQKLLDNGLTPAPVADRSTLLRRASFDVIGLPPHATEVSRFVTDGSPDAFEELVDRLLASPHFGERWGRHWLDLVRYAESRGHEFDYDVANAHQYRSYVIRALNDDVPYDQFVVEHVAGDLLSEETNHPLRLHPLTGANESILGTGFWFLGEWVHSPVDIRADEAERFANMIDVYSKTFLGLTVACARCHDHKFDPVTTKDFYALQAYLQSSHYQQARFETMEHNRRIADESEELFREAQAAILPVYQKLVNAAVDELDQYLLAARDVFQSSHASDGETLESRSAEPLLEFVLPFAEQHQLDPVTLAAWIRHLPKAAEDVSDPFHVWGKVCVDRLADPVAVKADNSRQRDRESQAEQIVAEQNSYLRVGEAIRQWDVAPSILARNVLPLTDDLHRPYRRIEPFIHQRNPLFADLEPADDADAEPGAVGHRRSLGATIRSQTFEIQKDRLCVKVRGDASVYLAVDSHILIKGPLHGQLFSNHPASDREDDAWRWITLDVSRYRGHRAHVELLPHAGRPFSLAGVWQRDLPPPTEQSRSWGCLWSANTTLATFQTFETLAETLASAFREIDCLDPHFVSQPDLNETYGSPLNAADWVVTHPELFGLDRPERRRQIAEVTRPFLQQMRRLQKQVRAVSELAPAMADGSTEVEYVFIRGNWKKPGDLVAPQFLEVFDGNDVPAPDQGSGRLDLAEWMVDPEKTPLLPRVIVNRIWQHYFGRGIVPTPDDFGYMGQDPSHPELLDWLACELVDSGWSMKHIHRLILTSAAYQMASVASAESSITADIDPDNRLLSRQNVKRLEGEAIRDAILSLSGRLDRRLYGKSVPVHLTPFMEGRGRPSMSGPVDGAGRRSLYIAVRRNFPDPFFQAFDMPNPHSTVGRRNVSNVPAQALAMMNNPLVVEQARRWGERLIADAPVAELETRIRHAYMECLAREPDSEELAVAISYFRMRREEPDSGADDKAAWSDFCHVLLNTKEFQFLQ